MKDNKMVYGALVLVFFFLATSCDPALNQTFIIVNNTDVELKLYIESYDAYLPEPFYNDDSLFFDAQSRKASAIVTLYPQTQDTLYYQMEIGLVSGSNECQIPLDSICLKDQHYHLKKDLMDSKNWERVVRKEFRTGGGNIDCLFEINNEDLAESPQADRDIQGQLRF